jgi:hypothetical protein
VDAIDKYGQIALHASSLTISVWPLRQANCIGWREKPQAYRIMLMLCFIHISIKVSLLFLCLAIWLDNNCDVIDNNGFSSALHYAGQRGSVDIVDLLLRNKCNINQCQPGTNKSLLNNLYE